MFYLDIQLVNVIFRCSAKKMGPRKKKIQPLNLAFLEKFHIEIVINDNRNILYETDFFISKNWRLYFFYGSFFFIFQSPEQI